MWSALGSVLLGVLGWLITSFFAKPLIDFLDLRRKVHEEIVYTGNIGAMQLGQKEDRAKFDEAVEDLRRLGAKVQATNVAATWPLRIFRSRFGYDLGKAGRGLNRAIEFSPPGGRVARASDKLGAEGDEATMRLHG